MFSVRTNIASPRPHYQTVLEAAGVAWSEIIAAARADESPRPLSDQIKEEVEAATRRGIRPPDGPVAPGTPENRHDLKLRELGYKALMMLQNHRIGKSGRKRARRDDRKDLESLAMAVLPPLTSHELREMLKAVALADKGGGKGGGDLSVLHPALPPEAERIGKTSDGAEVFLQSFTDDPEKRAAMRAFAADMVTDSHDAKTERGKH